MVELSYVVVLITAGSREEAHRIADTLVSHRKAACVNVVPGVDSLYWWQGRVQTGEESLLVVKTRGELFPGIVDLVKKVHSYEVPEVIALPVIDGNTDYLAWIVKETQMERGIKITVGGLEVRAWLNETGTASKVWEVLPITSTVSLWGDEIYFSTPVDMGLEDEKEVVNLGDIAYWPQGKAICLFFGRTPASQGEESRPVSPVNVVGQIEGDPRILKGVKPGDKITIERG
mgnify:CR=1 FL=1